MLILGGDMAIEVRQNGKEFELWFDDLNIGSSKLQCDAELAAKLLRKKVDSTIDRIIGEADKNAGSA
jgi:hypothetical protein